MRSNTVAEQGLTPESIGILTAAAISVLTFLMLTWRKIAEGVKGIFTPIWGVAEILMLLKSEQKALKEDMTRHEQLIANQELQLRGSVYLKTDNELIHENLDDHEARMRTVENKISEAIMAQENFKKDMIGLNQSISVLSLQSNQIMLDFGLIGEQMKALNQRGEMTSDQLDMLLNHLLPPATPRRKRKDSHDDG